MSQIVKMVSSSPGLGLKLKKALKPPETTTITLDVLREICSKCWKLNCKKLDSYITISTPPTKNKTTWISYIKPKHQTNSSHPFCHQNVSTTDSLKSFGVTLAKEASLWKFTTWHFEPLFASMEVLRCWIFFWPEHENESRQIRSPTCFICERYPHESISEFTFRWMDYHKVIMMDMMGKTREIFR